MIRKEKPNKSKDDIRKSSKSNKNNDNSNNDVDDMSKTKSLNVMYGINGNTDYLNDNKDLWDSFSEEGNAIKKYESARNTENIDNFLQKYQSHKQSKIETPHSVNLQFNNQRNNNLIDAYNTFDLQEHSKNKSENPVKKSKKKLNIVTNDDHIKGTNRSVPFKKKKKKKNKYYEDDDEIKEEKEEKNIVNSNNSKYKYNSDNNGNQNQNLGSTINQTRKELKSEDSKKILLSSYNNNKNKSDIGMSTVNMKNQEGSHMKDNNRIISDFSHNNYNRHEVDEDNTISLNILPPINESNIRYEERRHDISYNHDLKSDQVHININNHHDVNKNANNDNATKKCANKDDSANFEGRKIYINNSNLNKIKYRMSNNYVRTAKYTMYDFFPKALLYQFNRIANVYFLLIAIIQSIRLLSPLNPITAIAPFVLVIAVSLIREGLEDYWRHVSDDKENSTPATRWSHNNWEIVQSQQLEVGDIVYIKDNGVIPADLLLLSCSNLTKIAYIETATLDGEKNNKPKLCIANIFNSLKEINKTVRIRGSIICNIPTSELTKFNGVIELNRLHNYSFNVKQLLYKGTFLRNTDWVVGVVCYTGSQTKIVLNSMKSNNKQSHLEKLVNTIILILFAIQILLCILIAIIVSFWVSNNSNPDNPENNKHYYLENDLSTGEFGIISFFSYLLLLNTFIPISLIVSLEMVKYGQGYFMSVDCKMYSNMKNRFARCNSVSLNEELGQIKYIFSDKTGTLTANVLKFRALVSGNNTFISEMDEHGAYKEFNFNKIENLTTNYSNDKDYCHEIFSLDKNVNISINNDHDAIHHLLYCLSLNHTMRVEKKRKEEPKALTKKMTRHEFREKFIMASEIKLSEVNLNEEFDLIYKGENPDEIILVDTAKSAGFIYLGGNESEAYLRTLKDYNGKTQGNDQKWTILKLLEFSSARGMMSVIVQNSSGEMFLYCKGGDKKLKALMSNNQPYLNYVTGEATKLSETGLRVLWIGFKPISKQEYDSWIVDHDRELNKLVEEKEIEKHNSISYKKIEQGITILGATAVEDKLQDNVPDTLKSLQTAGINIWVLTGDNLATAKNIAIMCNLLPKNMQVFELLDNEELFKKKSDPSLSIFAEHKLKEAEKIIMEFESQFPDDYHDSNLRKKSIIYQGLTRLLEVYNHVDKSESYIDNQEEHSNLKNNSNNNKKYSPKDLLKGVLVESDILTLVLPSADSHNLQLYLHPLAKKFLEITLNSNAVICCRVAPQQKALIVRMIKRNIKNAITLSVGDGANDVAMILEADVGVGIYGEEGTQAAMSADYAIGEFQNLYRLILVHGRMNYFRIGEMILYFFYKNFIFTLPQFFFAFYNFSGQTLYDDWYVSLYNVLFTTLPILIVSLLERDIQEDDGEVIEKALPYTYYLGRESQVFNIAIFVRQCFIALCESIIVFFVVLYIMNSNEHIMSKDGYVADIWATSITQFTCIILIVNYRLLVYQRYHTIFNTVVIVVTSYFLYFCYFIVSGYISFSKSQGTINELISFPHFYLCIFLITSICFLFELGFKTWEIQIRKQPPSLLRKYIKVSPISIILFLKEEKLILNNKPMYLNKFRNEEGEKLLNEISAYNIEMREKFKVQRVEIQPPSK